MEKNLMQEKPRPFTTTFFALNELAASIAQGLAITLGTLLLYHYAVQAQFSETQTRSMVFLALISANIFLTIVNRSTVDSLLTTLSRKNNLVYGITALTIGLAACIFLIPSIQRLFELAPLTIQQAGVSVAVGALGTLWFEGVKAWRRRGIIIA
jgi:Ca2+-transporting ATPase